MGGAGGHGQITQLGPGWGWRYYQLIEQLAFSGGKRRKELPLSLPRGLHKPREGYSLSLLLPGVPHSTLPNLPFLFPYSSHPGLKPHLCYTSHYPFCYPYSPFLAFKLSLFSFSSLLAPLTFPTSHRFSSLGLLCLPFCPSLPKLQSYHGLICSIPDEGLSCFLPLQKEKNPHLPRPSQAHRIKYNYPQHRRNIWELCADLCPTPRSAVLDLSWRLRLSYFNVCQLVTVTSSAAFAGVLYPPLQVWLMTSLHSAEHTVLFIFYFFNIYIFLSSFLHVHLSIWIETW